jgi:hypothetical protein
MKDRLSLCAAYVNDASSNQLISQSGAHGCLYGFGVLEKQRWADDGRSGMGEFYRLMCH